MAGAKKTVKRSSPPPVDHAPKKVLLGTPVRLVTLKTVWQCPGCSSQARRGILFRHAGVDYCSRACIARNLPAEA